LSLYALNEDSESPSTKANILFLYLLQKYREFCLAWQGKAEKLKLKRNRGERLLAYLNYGFWKIAKLF
jgi:hypothetical protein